MNLTQSQVGLKKKGFFRNNLSGKNQMPSPPRVK